MTTYVGAPVCVGRKGLGLERHAKKVGGEVFRQGWQARWEEWRRLCFGRDGTDGCNHQQAQHGGQAGERHLLYFQLFDKCSSSK